MRKLNLKKSYNFLLGFFIIISIINISHFSAVKQFDHDEYETIHILWSMQQGQALYKDFSVGHGPVFYLGSSFFWKTLGLKDNFNTVFLYRYLSFIWMLLILFITYKIGYLLFDKQAGFLGVLFLIFSVIFVAKAIEIRPDLIQNVFWLAGLYSLLVNIKKDNENHAYLTGLFWGLSVMTNDKVIIPILIALLVYFFIFRRIKVIIKIIFSALLVIFFWIFYLFSYDMLDKYLIYLNLKFFSVSLDSARGGIWFHFKEFISVNKLILSLYLLGAVKILISGKEKVYKYIVLLSGLLIGSVCFYGYWFQWYQIFLPLVMIISAYSCNEVLKAKLDFRIKYLFLFLLAGCLFVNFFKNNHQLNMSSNKEQIKEANKLLKITNKTDKFFYIWECNNGAYVFRPHLLYYWHLPMGINKLIYKYEKRDVLGKELYAALNKGECSVILLKDYEFEQLGAEAVFYIRKNYHKIYDGLWLTPGLAKKYYATKD